MKLVTHSLPYKSNTDALLETLNPLGSLVALESAAHEHENGRWSIIAANPLKTTEELKFNAQTCHLIETLLKELPSTNSELPFIGGIIGHASYGFANKNHENKKSNIANSLVSAALYTWAFIFDHKNKASHLVYWTNISQISAQELIDFYNKPVEAHLTFSMNSEFSPNWSKQVYQSKIQIIHDYIKAGDAYQVNLTQKFNGKYTGSPLDAYRRIKAQSNSPYLTYFELNGAALASASPELFIQCHDGKVITKPIKGTTPRFSDKKDDLNSIQTLKNSQKDRAENLMITDLLRNDLSISCTNTKTPKLFEIESFETVHHLVSTITANKPKAVSPLFVFKTCFPGGSITGAPKSRAMEIISELEDFSREFYCGSSFYYSANQNFSSNILIRSFAFKDDIVSCWAGGGITIDSNWESEYQESLDKISKLMKVLEQ
jgi:para-aminobenzoate synthetase component 1